MTETITPVILCGGSGTRLWPVSRQSYPKQFSAIHGPESLYQGTLRRFSGPGFAPPLVVTGEAFRFIAAQQMAETGIAGGTGPADGPADGAGTARLLIEPVARNTAPAVLAAALALGDRDALMLVAPSDHVVRDVAAFRAAVMAGVPAARAGRLVTFGIVPGWAETGYGYLELPEAPDLSAAATAHDLVRFVEKPDAARAAEMLATGRFLWNAGVFLFTAGTLIDAVAAHAPALLAPCREAVARARPDLDFLRLDPDAFAGAADISIDYAVMEKAANLAVVPYTGGWSDLGAWDAVWREMGPDAAGVAAAGPATAIDCTNTLLRSEREDLELVGIGLDNVVAIAMPDAVLVADMARAQQVRAAIPALKARGAPQAAEYPRAHRPWGWYETLALGSRFQVKRITVYPGGRLSLQSHHHRAEHWVVVAGTARVTVGDAVSLLTENESVYIPLGAVHRLENPGKLDLVLIEVQSGGYLSEDDIVRYEDAYARV